VQVRNAPLHESTVQGSPSSHAAGEQGIGAAGSVVVVGGSVGRTMVVGGAGSVVVVGGSVVGTESVVVVGSVVVVSSVLVVVSSWAKATEKASARAGPTSTRMGGAMPPC